MKRTRQAKGLNNHQKQANHDWESAKRLLFRDGCVDTTFFLLFAEDRTLAIPVAWDTDDEKVSSIAAVRLLMISTKAEAVSVMSEMWTRDVRRRVGESNAEQLARAKAVRPSEAEDRIDSLMTCLYYYDDANEMQTSVRIGEIQRNDRGKPCAVTPLTFMGEMDGEGRMEDFVYKILAAEVTPDERELARSGLPPTAIQWR
jgi:hypothetical protein